MLVWTSNREAPEPTPRRLSRRQCRAPTWSRLLAGCAEFELSRRLAPIQAGVVQGPSSLDAVTDEPSDRGDTTPQAPSDPASRILPADRRYLVPGGEAPADISGTFYSTGLTILLTIVTFGI